MKEKKENSLIKSQRSKETGKLACALAVGWSRSKKPVISADGTPFTLPLPPPVYWTALSDYSPLRYTSNSLMLCTAQQKGSLNRSLFAVYYVRTNAFGV
ncbi:hypothetical protein OUZ56_017647 [Daphnia magna]|uniref:Uncharacterized protein n=1 Tax=Daphnia magna TaxID=35525 RepID=A0ABR0ATC6_9CRUS|nr:hypothetical protein OUZ56_017647 [Daphnia magna]